MQRPGIGDLSGDPDVHRSAEPFTQGAATASSHGASVAQCAASTSAMAAATAFGDRLDDRVVLEIGGEEDVGAGRAGVLGERGARAAADGDRAHRRAAGSPAARTPQAVAGSTARGVAR